MRKVLRLLRDRGHRSTRIDTNLIPLRRSWFARSQQRLLQHRFINTNGGYEFNLALAGMALTLLIVGAGPYSLDSFLGILW